MNKRFTYLIILTMLIFSSCGSQKQLSQTSGSNGQKKSEKKNEYSKIITGKAETDKGLFYTHKVDDKYYFEIPDSLLGKEILLVSRISGLTQNMTFGGAGMKARPQQVIRFEKKDKKLLLRHVSYQSVADYEQPIYESIKNNNFEPVVEAFEVKTLNDDSTSYVIEVNDFFNSDIALLSGLSEGQKTRFKIRGVDKGRSYIERINSYPENVEVRHVLTYNSNNPPDDSETGTLSLEMNQSMILLPKKPMRPHLADPRVGYFSIEQYQYGDDQQKVLEKEYITKWKLVPKDKEAYLKGELVEPVKPIIYYVDPATPVKWRKYIMQGVEDWNVAFEAAGFKNAIKAMNPPNLSENPDFTPENVKYSTIRYITTPIQNAQGPHVHDPRTGEILESDILWYHNVMNLLRNWYLIQTAAVNPDARGVEFKDEVMGELIRFVSAHEVGHTLGLPHNWGSSYAYPVDSLRSPTFTATHGTAPSIMDYARFNYIAQPGDNVTNLHPRVGEYDKWAIKWGYTWFPEDMTPDEVKEKLDEWVLEKADDPAFFYGSQTGTKMDPRSQNEDLGNDAVLASKYGLANLKRILPKLQEWTYEAGEDFSELDELYNQVIGQWNRYVGHVTANIGGIYKTPKMYEQEGPVYVPVPEETQKKAVNFLLDEAFETPEWMIDADLLSKVEHGGALERIRRLQVNQLENILDIQRMARMLEVAALNDGDVYTLIELNDNIRRGIWKELRTSSTIDPFRRNLQRGYLDHMNHLLNDDITVRGRQSQYYDFTGIDVSQSDLKPIMREQLQTLRNEIRRGISRMRTREARIHLQDALDRIDNILDPQS